MELFGTPPEDFLVSSAAGSMWTWVAVLTAALGLWRIRTAGSKSDAPPTIISPPPPPLPPRALMAQLVKEEIRTTKERFTMVYSSDSAEEGGDNECDEIREEEEELVGGGEADGELEAPLERSEWMGEWVRKRSDLGWYRYQDRMVINGSVVRLWCGGGLRRRL
ncbi:hypothetical protein M5K25_022928 [Dendrobium thyrsiflorum]|uniref:Uncharacterized protein n=1 Tax=Dendrobium thyrsiflorum TaxID=117978 RepID=A0ABD0U725_DENTH